ncbi:MAG: hypothetical protein KGL90_05850 [Burkholderiales bacterium]|nr:hypothetical protein [Burkholderiales bacterium]
MTQLESRFHKLLRQQSFAFLGAALLASVLAALLGSRIAKDQPVLSQLLLMFGGSGLGTCFGLVFGSLTKATAVQHITALIEESLHNPFNAPDQELDPFRKVWHHYLMTKMDGKVIWRYRTMDFARLRVPRKLVATFEVTGTDATKHTYHVEAFLASPRLMFIQRAAVGAEPPIIHVYPTATELLRPQHAGIAYLKSWEGEYLSVPVLMSEKPLQLGTPIAKEGTLPDATFQALDELWAREAARVGLKLVSR